MRFILVKNHRTKNPDRTETTAKYWISKLTKFSFPLVLLCSFLYLLPVDKTRQYYLSKKTTTVFVGDSHTNFAIQAGDTFANYSQNSQSMAFTYHIIKKLVTLNDQISCVVIGLAPHNVIDDPNRFTEQQYAKYFHLFSPEEQKQLFAQRTITNYLTFFRAFILEKFNSDLYANEPKKYKQPLLNQKMLQKGHSLKQRINFQYYQADMVKTTTTRDSVYYRKVKELLNTKNIRLQFLSTPVFSDYENQIPLNAKVKLAHLIQTYQLPYLNLSSCNRLEFSPQNFIRDGDHLSYEGALKFTKYLTNSKLF